MSDQPYPPDEPLEDNPEEEFPVGMEDHELPTRRIQAVDSDMLAQTQASTTVPPDLPDEEPSSAVTLSDLLNESPDQYSADEWQETIVNPAIPPAPLTPADIPIHTYRDDLPYDVPDSPPEPAVYGGLNDDSTHQEAHGRGFRLARGKTARERRDSGLYLPWWSLLILLAVVAFFAALLVLGLNMIGGQFSPGGETPVVIIVTSTPTRRPSATPTITAPAAPDLSTSTPVGDAGIVVQETPLIPESGPVVPTLPIVDPTNPSVITPPPDFYNVSVGKEVEVFDTEVGLNVRGGPGTGFEVVFIADDATLLQVVEGPVPAGEFTWWKLRDEANQEGWAVEDFIRVPQP